jgi:hypothetical protein
MTLPWKMYLPASFPSAHPAYAPVTIVTGHFCHSRSLDYVLASLEDHVLRN